MRRLFVLLVSLAVTTIVTTSALAAEPFAKLADRYWDEALAREPAFATGAGIHDFDDKMPDYSPAAFAKLIARMHEWQKIFDGVDAKGLTRDDAIDLQVLKLAVREQLAQHEIRRDWQRLPRVYSGAALNAVYLIVKRDFAPLPQRLASVIAREEQIPKLLADARLDLKDPAKISVELALEELPSSIGFLKDDTVQAFAQVKDPALRKRFAASTAKATRALAEYGEWLKKTWLPKAKPSFAIGKDAFVALLAGAEGIDTPLDQLLAQGEAELARLHDLYVATAKQIDPTKPATEVQAALAADHGSPKTLLADVSARLAGLRQFLVDKGIVTVPSPVMPIVQESPPFMRAFTLASMDTPGPYETHANEAYYNVTLPDPSWPPAEVESYMRGGFSRWIIQLVSIHEAFPGHYVQFLWMPKMPTRTRKLYSCASNAEGWAHYSEQMMLDEGWGHGDPKLRLAQVQEALLRAARYVVGIRMHTQGMSMADAQQLFMTKGLQSQKVAEMETKRGTEDPTYLYYTWGKLQILKLREDYKKKLGAQYTLRKFHDAFLALGAIPLPILRKALLE
jgi:uncharacterized protein (DUF885 family)